MIKFRKFRNVYRKNFKKIDVKIKILTIDKQILKKIVENYEKRFQKTLIRTFQKNLNKKNAKLYFFRNKAIENINQ